MTWNCVFVIANFFSEIIKICVCSFCLYVKYEFEKKNNIMQKEKNMNKNKMNYKKMYLVRLIIDWLKWKVSRNWESENCSFA